jgi:hypothetical protein
LKSIKIIKGRGITLSYPKGKYFENILFAFGSSWEKNAKYTT